MHLENAVEQLVILGERDPLTIARKIIERYGEDWTREELWMMAEEILAQIARNRLGSVRRTAEFNLQPGDYVSQDRMRLSKMWIPEHGYKVASDCTSLDLRARADFYRNAILSMTRREQWCREVADMIDAEGVTTLGQLKAELPPLPDEEDIII